MEPKSIRYVRFKDDEIYGLLKEKEELISQLKIKQSEIDAIAEEGTVLGNKVQKIKDKAIPLMEAKTEGIELGEYEIITTFQIDGDEIAVQILDQVEGEKERIVAAKKAEEEQKRVNKDESSPSNSDTK